MPSYTKNYELVKPTELEHYDLSVTNGNADKIDEVLHNLEITKETTEGAQAKADAAAQRAIEASVTEAEKGAPGGIATLDENGKLTSQQWPDNTFDRLGAAAEVQGNLDNHIADTANPHGVTAAQTGAIPAADKGASGGVASLDETGKVPAAQLPPMDYDPAGSAAQVQSNLNAHTGNTGNPHSVTAAQVGAVPTAEKGAAGGVATLDGNGKIVAAQMPDTGGSAEEVQAHLDDHIADTVKHVTAAERTDWNSKASGDHTHTAAQVGARPENWLPTAAEIDAVPTNRTVNGKALSADISLTAADVGGAAASHNQAASTITAGTFPGQVKAGSSGQTYSTYLLRNSRLSASEANPTVNGEICWVYE